MSTSEEAMSGIDTAWLRMDRPTNLMMITSLLITEPMDFASFRELIHRRFLAFDRFTHKPVQRSGGYYWQPDVHFDLDAHVRRTALPGNGGRLELQRLVSELISTPLDYSKPLWQFYYVENYGDQSALIMRIHHCYADGLSLMSVFDALTEESPGQNAAADLEPEACESAGAVPDEIPVLGVAANDETIPEADETPTDTCQQLINAAVKGFERYARVSLKMSEEGIHMLHEPSSLKALGRLALNAISEVSRLAALPSDPKTAIKGALGVRKECVWTEPVSLERFKRIGRPLGCSLNDVLISCVTGGLRRYLAQSQVPLTGLDLHATVPVHIQLPEEDSKSQPSLDPLGNRLGAVFVALPVGIEQPLERIYRIKHEMQSLRRSMQPGISYGILTALGLMPGTLQSQVTELFGSKSSLVLSNVPGVQRKRYLAGAEVNEIVYWVPQSGDVALGVSLLSYRGQIQIGLVADKQVIHNPRQLIDAFTEELLVHERLFAKDEADAGRSDAPGVVLSDFNVSDAKASGQP